jgi:hypothetical protein
MNNQLREGNFDDDGEPIEAALWGSDVIFLEYIDLEDKNGKEIYVGDIVKDAYGQINAIKFHAGSFWFNWLECPHYNDQIEKGEIIGNIYENPELMP